MSTPLTRRSLVLAATGSDRLSFMILAPGTEDDPLYPAWRLANQKWAREEEARNNLLKVRADRAPMSVHEAAERDLAFAETETQNAILLYTQEAQLSLATHEGRARWSA